MILKSIVPGDLKKSIKRYLDVFGRHELQSSVSEGIIGPSGGVAARYARASCIPGWFTYDDCAHFHLLLTMLQFQGVKGDMLEIGSYHGRAAAIMAHFLNEGENFVICDIFEKSIGETYKNPPTEEDVIHNVIRLNSHLDRSRLEIHKCNSKELKITPGQMFKFAHIDGAHSSELAYHDLSIARDHLSDGGVIAIDDYHSSYYPGVTKGVDQFLSDHPNFKVIADLNRHGCVGRKLYIRL